MRRLPFKTLFIAALIIVSLARTASAADYCFEQAGQMYGISPQILWAIAKSESHFNPRAVNWNKNGSYDYGVMQINSSWSKVMGPAAWNALSNPCYNIKVGAWILSLCIRKYGYTWKAIGYYNSSIPDMQAQYEWNVWKNLPKIALR